MIEAIPDDQVVVVDDGSTRKNQEILKLVMRRFKPPNAILLRQPNQGVAAALNLGLKECRHDLIARLDMDDWNVRGRIMLQLESRPSNSFIHGCAMVQVNPNGSESFLLVRETDPEILFRQGRPVCFHPTWVVDRESLVAMGGYPTGYPWAEDLAVQVLSWRNGSKLTNHMSPLVRKHQHDLRVSVTHHAEQMQSVRRIKLDFGLS